MIDQQDGLRVLIRMSELYLLNGRFSDKIGSCTIMNESGSSTIDYTITSGGPFDRVLFSYP